MMAATGGTTNNAKRNVQRTAFTESPNVDDNTSEAPPKKQIT